MKCQGGHNSFVANPYNCNTGLLQKIALPEKNPTSWQLIYSGVAFSKNQLPSSIMTELQSSFKM
jgi:hypothetical protein